MVFQPRSVGDIYDSIRSQLEDSVDKLTNFVDGSFNDEWTESYSEQVREAELKALAAEIGGWVEYAGKDLTYRDLDEFGIDHVEPEEINQYMGDWQLDYLAANQSVSRDPGTRATGTIQIETVDDSVQINEGMRVGTDPDSDGDFYQYRVDLDGDGEIDPDGTSPITPDDGETYVEVDIIADDVGSDYNTGVGAVTYIPNPQPSIRSVTNITPVDGGEGAQSNESLRDDIQNAIFESAGGGTRLGLESYIENEASADISVSTDERFDLDPSQVDVVIEGGDDDELEQLIEESRPLGVKHNLVRPNVIMIAFRSYVNATDLDAETAESTGATYIESLGMSEDFSWSMLLNQIASADPSVSSVPVLVTYVTAIDRERFEYDVDTKQYELNFGPLGVVDGEEHIYDPEQTQYPLTFSDVDHNTVTVRAYTDGSLGELTQDEDYSVIDVDDEESEYDGRTVLEFDGVDVDEYTTVEVDYTHDNVEVTKIESVDEETVYDVDDVDLVDTDDDGHYDSIEWTNTDTEPDDGERLELSYMANTLTEGDMVIEDREKVSPCFEKTAVNVFSE